MAHPQGGSPSTVSRSNWNLEMLVFDLRRGENRSTRRKTSRSKDENHQQTPPTSDAESGTRTRATLRGGESSHHCAIPAPPPRIFYLFIHLNDNSVLLSSKVTVLLM